MITVNFEEAKAELKRIAGSGDIWGALKYLNSRTPHRYSAVNLFHDPACINLYAVDKQDPRTYILYDAPVEATFCSLTRRLGQTMTIEDTMAEEDFDGHPVQRVFRSYIAVPLVDVSSEILGTVCHFDQRVLPVNRETVELLEALGPMLVPDACERRAKLLATSLN